MWNFAERETHRYICGETLHRGLRKLKKHAPSPRAAMALVDLCRLCGFDTLNILRNAIFEGEGRVKKYALKISECLALQVGSLYFHFPKVIIWLNSAGDRGGSAAQNNVRRVLLQAGFDERLQGKSSQDWNATTAFQGWSQQES
jgi:hypothetical protein